MQATGTPMATPTAYSTVHESVNSSYSPLEWTKTEGVTDGPPMEASQMQQLQQRSQIRPRRYDAPWTTHQYLIPDMTSNRRILRERKPTEKVKGARSLSPTPATLVNKNNESKSTQEVDSGPSRRKPRSPQLQGGKEGDSLSDDELARLFKKGKVRLICTRRPGKQSELPNDAGKSPSSTISITESSKNTNTSMAKSKATRNGIRINTTSVRSKEPIKRRGERNAASPIRVNRGDDDTVDTTGSTLQDLGRDVEDESIFDSTPTYSWLPNEFFWRPDGGLHIPGAMMLVDGPERFTAACILLNMKEANAAGV